MISDFIAMASFVTVTTFTPGPNNITSASMGILYGYRRTLKYLSGIAVGFFLIMLLCGLISSTLLRMIPAFEGILRPIGAVYILWLAYHTWRASYTFDEEEHRLLGFPQGFILQILNPKVIIYGLTMYASFLSGIGGDAFYLPLSALALAGIAFFSISIWTLFGTSIRVFLDRPRARKLIHAGFSLLLVYTAVELSGILTVLNPGA